MLGGVANVSRRASVLPLPLSPFVETIGYSESDRDWGLERCIPTGGVSIEINLEDDEYRIYEDKETTPRRFPGAVFVGPAVRPTVIDSTAMRRSMFVGFRVGGAVPFLPMPPHAALNELIPLGDLWGRDGQVARERLIEAPTPEAKIDVMTALLVEQFRSPPGDGFPVARAASGLATGRRVADVADRLGLLPKRFSRLFKDAVGLTPKQFARIARLRSLLLHVDDPKSTDWALLAVTHGYYDQSHLIHEFQELTGVTPTAYHPRSPAAPGHLQGDAS